MTYFTYDLRKDDLEFEWLFLDLDLRLNEVDVTVEEEVVVEDEAAVISDVEFCATVAENITAALVLNTFLEQNFLYLS